MQLFPPSPMTRSDAYQTLGFGLLCMTVTIFWTAKKVRARTFESAHLIKIVLLVAVSLGFLFISAQ